MSLVSQAHRQVLAQECALVELAAHWADLHHPDSQVPVARTLPGAEQGRHLGGDGTPEVLEFAAAELGAGMETTIGSARALMADALEIRHRLPELWQLILAGRVPSWRARKVAQATRHLSRDAAMHVDAAVAGCICTLPWARFETLLAAKIIEADPRGAEEQAQPTYAAPKPSASSPNPRWRCSCCGNFGASSTQLANLSRLASRSSMNPTCPTTGRAPGQQRIHLRRLVRRRSSQMVAG
jgi:hypothetical protein